MPQSIVNTLSKIRAKKWGVLPQTRDEFDIRTAISKAKTAVGEDIIVFDSNDTADLPEDWQTMNLKDIVTELRTETPSQGTSVASSVGSSIGTGVGINAADANLIDDVSLNVLKTIYPSVIPLKYNCPSTPKISKFVQTFVFK